jgi:hypothetical protein
MAKVVRVIELMSQSPKSWEDAAQAAVQRANKTLRDIRSIYVKESPPKWTRAKSQTIASTQRSLLTSSAVDT